MAKRTLALHIPTDESPKQSRIYLDADIADLVRRVASHDGLTLNECIEGCLRAYIAANHPDWELTEVEQTSKATRRRGP